MTLRCWKALFVEWLEELQRTAEQRGSNLKFVYRKAISSLKAHREPIYTPFQAGKLKNIGPTTVKVLHKRIVEHCRDNGLPEPTFSHPGSGQGIEGDDDGGSGRGISGTRKRKAAPKRDYMPRRRSGAYAILLAFHTAEQNPSYVGYLLKREVQALAQPHSETSFTMHEAGNHYNAWSAMKTVISKGLVDKRSNPAKYSLTEKGRDLAARLHAAEAQLLQRSSTDASEALTSELTASTIASNRTWSGAAIHEGRSFSATPSSFSASSASRTAQADASLGSRLDGPTPATHIPESFLDAETYTCDGCKVTAAALWCRHCGDRFCLACDAAAHRSAAKQGHRRYPLQPSKDILKIPSQRSHSSSHTSQILSSSSSMQGESATRTSLHVSRLIAASEKAKSGLQQTSSDLNKNNTARRRKERALSSSSSIGLSLGEAATPSPGFGDVLARDRRAHAPLSSPILEGVTLSPADAYRARRRSVRGDHVRNFQQSNAFDISDVIEKHSTALAPSSSSSSSSTSSKPRHERKSDSARSNASRAVVKGIGSSKEDFQPSRPHTNPPPATFASKRAKLSSSSSSHHARHAGESDSVTDEAHDFDSFPSKLVIDFGTPPKASSNSSSTQTRAQAEKSAAQEACASGDDDTQQLQDDGDALEESDGNESNIDDIILSMVFSPLEDEESLAASLGLSSSDKFQSLLLSNRKALRAATMPTSPQSSLESFGPKKKPLNAKKGCSSAARSGAEDSDSNHDDSDNGDYAIALEGGQPGLASSSLHRSPPVSVSSAHQPPRTPVLKETQRASLAHRLGYMTPEEKAAKTKLSGLLNSEKGTSASFLLAAGSYDIVLLVDTSEITGARKETGVMLQKLLDMGVKAEARTLSVGDFHWVAREKVAPSFGALHPTKGREIVLDFIVERKRLDDLVHSIKDGRLKEQKRRLQNSTAKAPMYLIEHYGSIHRERLPADTILQTIVNTHVCDNFLVKETSGVNGSVAFLTLASRFIEESHKHLHMVAAGRGARELCASLGESASCHIGQEFKEFYDANVKTPDLSVARTFVWQLAHLSGLTLEKAGAIITQYPTPGSLMNAITEDRGKTLRLLQNLTYKSANGAERKVGATHAAVVVELYS